MLAEKNPYIASAAQTIYRVTEADYIRNMCEAREEGEKTQRTIELLHQMELQQAQEILQQRDEALQQKDEVIQQKDEVIQQKDAQLAAALARIAELEAKQK